MVGYSRAPVYLSCICHAAEGNAQTYTHTHTLARVQSRTHAQVKHTHVAYVCCQKDNKNIFAADLILLYFAIFICFFFAQCVRVHVCGRQDGWVLVCLRMPYTSHSAQSFILSPMCEAKTSFICIFTLACRLSSSTRSLSRSRVLAAGCRPGC